MFHSAIHVLIDGIAMTLIWNGRLLYSQRTKTMIRNVTYVIRGFPGLGQEEALKNSCVWHTNSKNTELHLRKRHQPLCNRFRLAANQTNAKVPFPLCEVTLNFPQSSTGLIPALGICQLISYHTSNLLTAFLTPHPTYTLFLPKFRYLLYNLQTCWWHPLPVTLHHKGQLQRLHQL